MHLAPNGVRAFDSGLDVIPDAHPVECLANGHGEVFKEFVALFFGERELADDVGILLGMLVAEAKVFEFGLDFVQSEPVGNGA